MIALALVVLAMSLAGFALSSLLWQRETANGEGATPLERASSWFVVTFAVSTAANWLLAATHHWRAVWLCALALTVGALGLWGTYAFRPRVTKHNVAGFIALLLSPIAVWVVFVLVRSTLLPVMPHDGLNYHLPKAVLLLREGGFGWFETSNLRIAAMPCDYELILSSILMLTGSDALTAWPSTVAYVFFLVSSAALAERFWGRGLHVLAAPLLVAGVPLALLHAGAHKQDLLVAALETAAFATFGRWASRGGFAPAALTILALGLAVGTKITGVFALLIVLALLGLFALARQRSAFRFTRREWMALAGIVVFCVLLLGGVAYGMNFVKSGSVTGPSQQTVTDPGYGQWSNEWMFTVMLLIRPFARSDNEVWNPWHGNFWWWRKYDLYFSDFGAVFSVLCVALPYAVFRYRRSGKGDGRGTERWMASLPFLLTYVFIVPFKGRPLGLFAATGRYVLVVVPLVVVWTLVPFVRELLAANLWRRRLGHAVLVACAGIFVAEAVDIAIHDSLVGTGVIDAALRNPDLDLVHLGYRRAGILVDRLAEKDDHVAISGDFDTVLYPVFGRELRRPVTFIPDGPGPAQIPDSARWVIVDRTWNKYWNNPEFVDTSQFATHFRTGTASVQDLRVVRQLEHDPAWVVRYRNDLDNQAIFMRRPSTGDWRQPKD